MLTGNVVQAAEQQRPAGSRCFASLSQRAAVVALRSAIQTLLEALLAGRQQVFAADQ